MKHLFLPYELAISAKEKGFDNICFAYYVGKELVIDNDKTSFINARTNAPLYQQIVDWFETKHKIIFCREYTLNSWYWVLRYHNNHDKMYFAFDTLNIAIEEAFKLI